MRGVMKAVAGGMMTSRFTRRLFAGVSLVAFVLPACSAPSSAPGVRPATSAALPDAAPPQAGTVPAADSRMANVNNWILSRAAPGTAIDDLPLGPGDLIVISVFLVSELSQLNVRIPSNGNIALPLIGVLPAAGPTAREV